MHFFDKKNKNNLRNITIGKTGYLYAIQKPSGDAKDGYFVLHPTFEGKHVQQIENPSAKEILVKLLNERNGKLNYEVLVGWLFLSSLLVIIGYSTSYNFIQNEVLVIPEKFSEKDRASELFNSQKTVNPS